MSLLISGLAWAGPTAIPQTQIVCSGVSSPTADKVIFQGPRGKDLRFLGAFSKTTVPLKINGSAKSFEFSVQKFSTRTGEQVHYTYNNPFFRSDIHIVLNRGFTNHPSALYATWTHDYPPATELDCEFSP